jgi:DNA polymerase III epsilon subunit-like protein
MKMNKNKFIFDIETSGLPTFSGKRKRGDFPKPSELTAYDTSRIVSICWVIVDENNEIINKEYYVVKPDNFIIPPNVIAIHGITNEYARDNGKPISFVIDQMHLALKQVDAIIAYNIDFDYNISLSEMVRLNNIDAQEEFNKKQRICCMKMAGSYLKSQRWVKLSKAFESIVGHEIVDAHNAEGDTISCLEVYKRICNA